MQAEVHCAVRACCALLPAHCQPVAELACCCVLPWGATPCPALPLLAANQVVTKLHLILRPFLLRRLKADVDLSIPPKHEYVLYTELTQEQVRALEHCGTLAQ